MTHTLTAPDSDGTCYVLINGQRAAVYRSNLDGTASIAPCLPSGQAVAHPDTIPATSEAIAEWLAEDLCDHNPPTNRQEVT